MLNPNDETPDNNSELPGDSGEVAAAGQVTAESVTGGGEGDTSTSSAENAPAPSSAEQADDQSGPEPEDSGEPGTNKEEASAKVPDDSKNPTWKESLQKFHDVTNDVLVEKEKLRLMAVDKKLHAAYIRNWKSESNRYFQLAVMLRRRYRGTKTSGKDVA